MSAKSAPQQATSSISLLQAAGALEYRRQYRLLACVVLVALVAVVILAQSLPALAARRPADLIVLAMVSAAAPAIFGLLDVAFGTRSPSGFALLVAWAIILGAEPAAWLAGIAGAATVAATGPWRPLRVAFAAASYVIGAFGAGRAFEIAGGNAESTAGMALPAAIAIVLPLVVLAVLRSLALICTTGTPTAADSFASTLHHLPSYVAMGGFGVGLALTYRAVGPASLLVFLLPSAVAGLLARRHRPPADEVLASKATLEQRLGDLQLANQVTSLFASMRTFEQTLQLAAMAATQLGGFRFAFILHYDENERSFKPGAVHGLDAQVLAAVAGRLCEGFAPTVVGRKELVVISEDHYALHVRELRSRGLDVTSLVLVPILSGEGRVGVLGVGSSEVTTDEHVRFLKALAGQTALAMDNASLYLRMKQLAVTDYVTGLHTHRFFQEVLDAEIKRCSATGGSLALVMLDLDHFKEVNDRFGHLAGDELLRQAGVRTRCALRRGDIMCRYGGDEFAAILPDSDAEQAMAIAERIRRAVADTPFVWTDGVGEVREIGLTLTIGIALLTGDGVTKDELIDRADRELYRAKEAGRNTLSISRTLDPALLSTAVADVRPDGLGGSDRWSKPTTRN